LLIATLVFSFVALAHATSCVPPRVDRSSEDADVIFVGIAGGSRAKQDLSITAFRVEQVYKGVVPVTIEVVGGGMRGARFDAGQRYLVLASFQSFEEGPSLRPFAGLCSGTGLVVDRTEWLAALGPAAAPARAGTPPSSGNPPAPQSAPSSNGDPPLELVPYASIEEAGPDAPPENAPPVAPSSPASASAPHASPAPDSATLAPPASAPPAATPPSAGGCAGCASGGRASDPAFAWWLPTAAALVEAARRRRAPRGAGPAWRASPRPQNKIDDPKNGITSW
jgi:hypothetical protein